jgi:hypothetical protein
MILTFGFPALAVTLYLSTVFMRQPWLTLVAVASGAGVAVWWWRRRTP